MARARLDRASLQELRDEASSYHLLVTDELTRTVLIDRIMTHLERCGPVGDLLGDVGEARDVSSNRPIENADEQKQPVTMRTLEQALSTMAGNILGQQQQFLQQQQQQFERLVQALTSARAAPMSTNEEQMRNGDGLSLRSSQTRPDTAHLRHAVLPAMTIPIPSLAAQIPEFGGTDNDNVQGWVQRMKYVARIHGVSDGAILLAATSRLTGAARKWYDLQMGEVIETWTSVRREMLKIFDRQIPFHKAMCKIEARKWAQQKESFDQYALEKLALTQRLNLLVRNVIQLILAE